MRKIMVKLLLVITLAFPVLAQAQDTATPDFPTQEVITNTPDVVTATPSPTDEPTTTPSPTETPVPPPVEPPPVDGSLVVPQLLIIGIVALGAFVTIAWVGIINAAKGLPEWSRPLFLSNLKSGVDTLDNLTDGPLSDAGITLLRQKIAELERELNTVKAQTVTNAENIATTNRVVSQSISSQ